MSKFNILFCQETEAKQRTIKTQFTINLPPTHCCAVQESNTVGQICEVKAFDQYRRDTS